MFVSSDILECQTIQSTWTVVPGILEMTEYWGQGIFYSSILYAQSIQIEILLVVLLSDCHCYPMKALVKILMSIACNLENPINAASNTSDLQCIVCMEQSTRMSLRGTVHYIALLAAFSLLHGVDL